MAGIALPAYCFKKRKRRVLSRGVFFVLDDAAAGSQSITTAAAGSHHYSLQLRRLEATTTGYAFLRRRVAVRIATKPIPANVEGSGTTAGPPTLSGVASCPKNASE